MAVAVPLRRISPSTPQDGEDGHQWVQFCFRVRKHFQISCLIDSADLFNCFARDASAFCSQTDNREALGRRREQSGHDNHLEAYAAPDRRRGTTDCPSRLPEPGQLGPRLTGAAAGCCTGQQASLAWPVHGGQTSFESMHAPRAAGGTAQRLGCGTTDMATCNAGRQQRMPAASEAACSNLVGGHLARWRVRRQRQRGSYAVRVRKAPLHVPLPACMLTGAHTCKRSS